MFLAWRALLFSTITLALTGFRVTRRGLWVVMTSWCSLASSVITRLS